jgi:2,4-dichlorophenol 6-monooxygenase
VIDRGPDGYADVTGAWEQQSGIDSGGAVLVRPDNHVGYRCARAAVDPEQELERALRTIMRIPAVQATSLS